MFGSLLTHGAAEPSPKAARKLRLKGILGSAKTALPGKSGTVTIKLSRTSRSKLAHQRKVVLVLGLVATDAAGNATKVTKRIALKR